MKAIYEEFTSEILKNSRELKLFPLRSGTRQEYTLSPFFSNIVLEVISKRKK
jgi:hypothetical protein